MICSPVKFASRQTHTSQGQLIRTYRPPQPAGTSSTSPSSSTNSGLTLSETKCFFFSVNLIALSPDSADQARVGRILLQLLAQVHNMHHHGIV